MVAHHAALESARTAFVNRFNCTGARLAHHDSGEAHRRLKIQCLSCIAIRLTFRMAVGNTGYHCGNATRDRGASQVAVQVPWGMTHGCQRKHPVYPFNQIAVTDPQKSIAQRLSRSGNISKIFKDLSLPALRSKFQRASLDASGELSSSRVNASIWDDD